MEKNKIKLYFLVFIYGLCLTSEALTIAGTFVKCIGRTEMSRIKNDHSMSNAVNKVFTILDKAGVMQKKLLRVTRRAEKEQVYRVKMFVFDKQGFETRLFDVCDKQCSCIDVRGDVDLTRLLPKVDFWGFYSLLEKEKIDSGAIKEIEWVDECGGLWYAFANDTMYYLKDKETSELIKMNIWLAINAELPIPSFFKTDTSAKPAVFNDMVSSGQRSSSAGSDAIEADIKPLVLNAQLTIPEPLLKDAFAKICSQKINVKNASYVDYVRLHRNFTENGVTGGVLVVESKTLPGLLIAPDEEWAVVNIKPLLSSEVSNAKRVARVIDEVMRAFTFISPSNKTL